MPKGTPGNPMSSDFKQLLASLDTDAIALNPADLGLDDYDAPESGMSIPVNENAPEKGALAPYMKGTIGKPSPQEITQRRAMIDDAMAKIIQAKQQPLPWDTMNPAALQFQALGPMATYGDYERVNDKVLKSAKEKSEWQQTRMLDPLLAELEGDKADYGFMRDDMADYLAEKQIDKPNEFEMFLSDPENYMKFSSAKRAGSGGSSVFSERMAMINSDPNLSQLPMGQKIQIATGKVGTNLTIGDNGTIVDMSGAAEGMKNLSYGDESGSQLAKNENEPGRAGDVEEAKLQQQLALGPDIEAAKATAAEIGKGQGEAQAKLNSMLAKQPRLQKVVSDLSALGKDATYTKAGQLGDIVIREAGIPVSKGAVDRTAYMAKVNDEVLPLLRETFGAAFTVQEGESLKTTLGDPNKSPEEKDAALAAFISSKAGEIESLKRQTKQPEINGDYDDPDASNSTGAPAIGTIVNGFRFKGGDHRDPKNWEKNI